MDGERDGTLGLPLLIVNGSFKNIRTMSVVSVLTSIHYR